MQDVYSHVWRSSLVIFYPVELGISHLKHLNDCLVISTFSIASPLNTPSPDNKVVEIMVRQALKYSYMVLCREYRSLCKQR